ncbi:MAG: diguanylate cyclase [Myxococcales bacterium]|nr:diguanylate cyclase [Myxococcales bacterium]
MRLSAKVAIALSVVVAGAATVTAVVVSERQASEQRAQFRETNLRALELLGLALAPAVAEGRHHRAQAVVDNVANYPDRYPDVRDLEVLDLRGRVVADMDPRRFGEESDAGGPPAAEATVEEGPDGELHVVVPLRLAHAVGTLRATLSEARLRGEIFVRKRDAVLFVLGTMSALGVALYALHRRVLGAPVAALARVAARIRAGEMSARAPARRGDELAELGDAFNDMASHLERYTHELEGAVRKRTAELEAANLRLKELATTDGLTKLSNRRSFEEQAIRDLSEATRSGRPVALVLCDVDRFKSYNDRYGHAFGDEVLRHVAGILRAEARSMDLVARVGGEEFAILMPDTGLDEASVAAERLREAVAKDPLGKGGERVTASFGVAATSPGRAALDALLRAADDALYASKRGGRNRVSLAPPAAPDAASDDPEATG